MAIVMSGRRTTERSAVRAATSMGIAAVVLLGGCGGGSLAQPPPAVPEGDPAAGARAIGAHGCGSCHTIPGIDGADATVGPPLNRWSRRGYIAGALPNTPDDLVRWISDPQGVEPGTAMPDLGVPPVVARDIAAYLYKLE
jgi:cytochrome c